MRKSLVEGTHQSELGREKQFPVIYIGFVLPRKISLETYKGKTCPNCDTPLLETFDRRRGAYGYCPSCGWHMSIQAEMADRRLEDEAFKALQEKYPGLAIAVKPLSADDPFQPLKQRRESGKRISYDAEGFMPLSFEIKKWVDYGRERFFNADHGYVSIVEVEELAKRDGYVIFFLTKDGYLLFVKATDIIQFAQKAYDVQGNLRYDLNREFKRRYVRDGF